MSELENYNEVFEGIFTSILCIKKTRIYKHIILTFLQQHVSHMHK